MMPKRKSNSEKKRVMEILQWIPRVLDFRPFRHIRKVKVSSKHTRDRDIKE